MQGLRGEGLAACFLVALASMLQMSGPWRVDVYPFLGRGDPTDSGWCLTDVPPRFVDAIWGP